MNQENITTVAGEHNVMSSSSFTPTISRPEDIHQHIDEVQRLLMATLNSTATSISTSVNTLKESVKVLNVLFIGVVIALLVALIFVVMDMFMFKAERYDEYTKTLSEQNAWRTDANSLVKDLQAEIQTNINDIAELQRTIMRLQNTQATTDTMR